MQRTTIFSVILATMALAACNAGPLLKTGSLSAKPAAAPLPTSIDRALHIGATSARAQKCGFYFDPAALRQNFLTAEAARGTPADALAKTGQSYDFTAAKVGASISNPKQYCSSKTTAQIKKFLQAALAGNFEVPPKKPVPQGGFWSDFTDGPIREEKWNRDEIYDPATARRTNG